jgi:hypothetical protein
MKADFQSVYAVCVAASQQLKAATTWEILAALSTFSSAIAIALTVYYAHKAYDQAQKTYDQAQYYEKVRLTVAMMEAPWLRKFSVRMRPRVARDLLCGFLMLASLDSIVKRCVRSA